MAATRYRVAWFPAPTPLALVAMWALVAPLSLAQGEAKGRPANDNSSPIAFPGLDAFGHISGLSKGNFSSAATRPPSQASAGVVLSGATADSTQGAASCAERLVRGWDIASPFSDGAANGQRNTLPDVRLAVESMFRLSNRLESLLRDPSGTNLLYSPLGLTSALGQLALAARGRTLDDLLRLLLPPAPGCGDAAFHASFRSLLAQVWSRRGSEAYELSVRNALFHQQQLLPALDTDFTNRLSRDYATEIFPTDFKNSPIFSQQQINLWAQRASKGKIDKLMPYIPPRTTTAIISSVIYFKAIWENQFNKQFTTKGTFFLDGDYRGRTKAVDFMSGEFELPYAESATLGCKMVALPYTNNETAMYLLLPLGSSKWKGPRPLPPLTIAHRDGERNDSLAARSALTDGLAPLPLNNAYYSNSGQRTYYNVGSGGAAFNSARPRGVPQYAPPYTQSYNTYQQTSNPQKLKRRQADAQQEVSRAYNPSQCQGSPSLCQPDITVGESPFSAAKMHDLANRLGAEEFNSLVLQAKQSQLVRVSLIIPKLSMTSNVKLREALAALGVNTVFGEDSDLSGAINQTTVAGSGEESQGSVWAVNEVWQQSRLEVTEEGTEAASGTAAGIVDYSLDSAIFKANSPFLAIIRHEATGTPIFWASVANPS